MTEQQIRAKFQEFNDLYFEGMLPQPKTIEFKFVKKYLGQFHWSSCYRFLNGELNPNAYSVLRISTAWQMTDFELEKVIIHEMIHSWQWVVGHCDNHGKYFKMKALEINTKTNYKYKISRMTAIENNTCLKSVCGKAEKCGVILYSKGSEKYIAVCSINSVNKIKAWFPNCYGVQNCKFYIVDTKKSSIFNHMIKSISRVHGYKFNDTKKSELKNCIISAA